MVLNLNKTLYYIRIQLFTVQWAPTSETLSVDCLRLLLRRLAMDGVAGDNLLYEVLIHQLNIQFKIMPRTVVVGLRTTTAHSLYVYVEAIGG